MRFCQIDGTPLVDDAPAFDPYATMVAPSTASMASTPVDDYPVTAIEPVGVEESEATTQIATFPVHESAIAEPEDVLDIPASDPLKTIYVSDSEMREALAAGQLSEEPLMEIPPVAEIMPEPPTFIASEMTSPPSPFAAEPPSVEPSIPSPFDSPNPVVEVAPIETPQYSSPEPTFEPPPFKEPDPVFIPAVSSPFEQSSTPAEWTPPPAPDASWQNQEIGANTPFQPPPAGAAGPSSILAIVSLALAIIGMLSAILTLVVSIVPLTIIICGILPFLLGIAAAITGFLARSRATSMPDKYSGRGIAMAGLVLGVLDIIAPFVIAGLWLLLWGGLSLFR